MTCPDLTEEQSKRSQEFSRAQVEAMCAYIEAERELTETREENATLRKMVFATCCNIEDEATRKAYFTCSKCGTRLLTDMTMWAANGKTMNRPYHCPGCGASTTTREWADSKPLMQELGIEVSS